MNDQKTHPADASFSVSRISIKEQAKEESGDEDDSVRLHSTGKSHTQSSVSARDKGQSKRTVTEENPKSTHYNKNALDTYTQESPNHLDPNPADPSKKARAGLSEDTIRDIIREELEDYMEGRSKGRSSRDSRSYSERTADDKFNKLESMI